MQGVKFAEQAYQFNEPGGRGQFFVLINVRNKAAGAMVQRRRNECEKVSPPDFQRP